MDSTAVIIVAIFAVVIVVAIFVYRRRLKASIKGPGGLGLDLDASNEPAQSRPGVHIERAKAGQDVVGEDATGKGAVIKDVDAGRDVRATASDRDNPSKKA